MEAEENNQGFPGEEEQEQNQQEQNQQEQNQQEQDPAAKEPAKKEPESEGGPWIAALIKIHEESGRIAVKQITDETFKLQIEADAWIKENAGEDDIYGSIRKGKFVKAEVVRKLKEV